MKKKLLNNYNIVTECPTTCGKQTFGNKLFGSNFIKKGYSFIRVTLFCFGISSKVNCDLNTEISLSYN